jgi:L-ascorbate oxidase
LIVEESEANSAPYQTDGERNILLQEIYNKTDTTVEDGLISTPLSWSGDANGFMINGKTISNYGITDPSSKELAVIDVDPGKVYRFRFVGGTTIALGAMGFENHTDFKVIEADGSYTKPQSIDFMQIGAGQRYSVLFETKTCDELKELGKLDYYIQAEPRDRDAAQYTNYAILRYSNTCKLPRKSINRLPTNTNPTTKPIDLPATQTDFLEYVLEPLTPFPSASEVTRRVILNVQQLANFSYVWLDNKVSWTEDADDHLRYAFTPKEPYLVSLYKNSTQYFPDYSAALANGGLDPATKTYPTRLGEVIEIVIQQLGSSADDGSAPGSLDSHPWHAHGGHYYDVGSGSGAFDAKVLEQQLAGSTPVKRDTTMLYRYKASVNEDQKFGWRAWRVRVQDPGVWMVHCHLLQHMIMGMQTVWVFGDEKDVLTLERPQVEGYLTYGGDVYGNSTHAPNVVHFSET